MRSYWVLSGVLLFSAALLFPVGSAKADLPENQLLAGASELIDQVNSLRISHGLPAYSVSSILMGTAQGQADYMASTGSISHTGPGGISVTNRLLNAGYPLAGDLSLGGFRSENIVGSPGMTPEGAVSSWTGDDLHLHTMLSADLTEIGAGVAENNGVTYYVIDCARPLGAGELAAYTPGAEAQLNGGNDIIVPVSIGTPDTQGDVYHVVQAGQSLWQIAISYGVKIVDIQRLNNLGSTTVIQQGAKLLIKRVSTPTPDVSTSTSTLPAATTAAPASTATLAPTLATSPTPTVATLGGSVTAGGAVAAIAVVALIAAALVAWAGRTRPI